MFLQPDLLNLAAAKTAKAANPAVAAEKSSASSPADNPAGVSVDIKDPDAPLKAKSTASAAVAAKETIALKDDAGPNIMKASKQASILKKTTAMAGSKYYAYNSKYALQKAFIKLQEKDLSKLKLKIDKIKYKEVEEPGVIPRTLDNVEDILKRFNTQEQPRIETILDSVNDNLTESKKAMNNANTEFENISAFVHSHSTLLKIFLAIAGLCILLSTATGDFRSGNPFALNSIAAIVVGGISLTGGKGNIWGAVIGALILGLLNNLIFFAQISSLYQTFAKGMIIVLSLSIATIPKIFEEKYKFGKN